MKSMSLGRPQLHQVVLVLGRQRRQVHHHARQVHVLPLPARTRTQPGHLGRPCTMLMHWQYPLLLARACHSVLASDAASCMRTSCCYVHQQGVPRCTAPLSESTAVYGGPAGADMRYHAACSGAAPQRGVVEALGAHGARLGVGGQHLQHDGAVRAQDLAAPASHPPAASCSCTPRAAHVQFVHGQRSVTDSARFAQAISAHHALLMCKCKHRAREQAKPPTPRCHASLALRALISAHLIEMRLSSPLTS